MRCVFFGKFVLFLSISYSVLFWGGAKSAHAVTPIPFQLLHQAVDTYVVSRGQSSWDLADWLSQMRFKNHGQLVALGDQLLSSLDTIAHSGIHTDNLDDTVRLMLDLYDEVLQTALVRNADVFHSVLMDRLAHTIQRNLNNLDNPVVASLVDVMNHALTCKNALGLKLVLEILGNPESSLSKQNLFRYYSRGEWEKNFEKLSKYYQNPNIHSQIAANFTYKAGLLVDLYYFQNLLIAYREVPATEVIIDPSFTERFKNLFSAVITEYYIPRSHAKPVQLQVLALEALEEFLTHPQTTAEKIQAVLSIQKYLQLKGLYDMTQQDAIVDRLIHILHILDPIFVKAPAELGVPYDTYRMISRFKNLSHSATPSNNRIFVDSIPYLGDLSVFEAILNYLESTLGVHDATGNTSIPRELDLWDYIQQVTDRFSIIRHTDPAFEAFYDRVIVIAGLIENHNCVAALSSAKVSN